MTVSDARAQFAWQPLTVRGVAAFAQASLGRLLVVQLIMALAAAGILVWFLHRSWFPVITQAIQSLPPQGMIRSGRLDWPESSPETLAEGRYLAIVVDLDHAREARSPAHVQVQFERGGVKLYSLLGYVEGAYPRDSSMAFNRTVLVPWWGAWAPAILAMVAGGVVVSLLVTWACFATIYTLPVWLIGFYANRSCSLGGSWRLAGAALMPGAVLICATLVFYGWGMVDLVHVAIVTALHFVVPWVYLAISPLCLPRHPQAEPKGNPFV